jgi:hypothetical protein
VKIKLARIRAARRVQLVERAAGPVLVVDYRGLKHTSDMVAVWDEHMAVRQLVAAPTVVDARGARFNRHFFEHLAALPPPALPPVRAAFVGVGPRLVAKAKKAGLPWGSRPSFASRLLAFDWVTGPLLLLFGLD